MIEIIDIKKLIIILLTDALVVLLVFFIPTFSHLCGLPLYLIEPMRLAVFLTLFTSDNKINSYFLAAALPLFSFMVGGHPILIKSLIMSMELIINVWLYWKLLKFNLYIPITVFVSILLSKIIYYFVKYILITLGILDFSLISTPILIQLGVIVAISSLFFFKKNNRNINICKYVKR